MSELFEVFPGYRTIRPIRTRGLPRELLAIREGPAEFRRLCSLRIAAAGDIPTTKALAREARILARLHHPAILPAYDFFELNGCRALVLAFDGGLTIEKVVAAMSRPREGRDDRAALYVVYTLFDALAHAHRKKDLGGEPVVHGDLHPANVLVRKNGHVQLRGFRGASSVRIARPDLHPRVDPGPYAAPELADGSPSSVASDLYGAAAVAWHLFVGTPPLPGAGSLLACRPDLPAELAAVLDVCLSREPARRSLMAGTVAATVRKAVDLQGARDDLERLFAKVLRELPAPIRATCASAPPTRHPSQSSWPTLPFRGARPGDPQPAAPTRDDSQPAGRFPSVDASARSGATGSLAAHEPHKAAIVLDLGDESSEHAVDQVAPTPFSYGAVVAESDSAVSQPRSLPPVAADVDAAQSRSCPERGGARRASFLGAVLVLMSISWTLGRYVLGPALSPPAVGSGAPAAPPVLDTFAHVASPGDAAAPIVAATSGADAAMPSASALRAVDVAITVISATRDADASSPSSAASEIATRPVDSSATADDTEGTVLFHQSELVVEGPPDGVVYLNGVRSGRTGERLVTRGCGLRFLRIGSEPTPGGLGFRWLTRGQPVMLPCGGAVTMRGAPR